RTSGAVPVISTSGTVAASCAGKSVVMPKKLAAAVTAILIKLDRILRAKIAACLGALLPFGCEFLAVTCTWQCSSGVLGSASYRVVQVAKIDTASRANFRLRTGA